MAKLSSTDKPVTKAELQEFYQQIFPYLGGNKAVDSSPIGTVISYMGATPPAGYLACDGSKLSATAYPLLFDVLKELPSATRSTWGNADWVTEFNVPNLYGEFPRFSGTNAHENQGNGANVGVHQDGTSFNPGWSNNSIGGFSMKETPSSAYTALMNVEYPDKVYQKQRKGIVKSETLKTENYTGSENIDYNLMRPTNTSFLPCIKYTYVTQEVEYSPEERVVGIWKQEINGVLKQKPVYQRTFVVDTVTGESSGTYTTGIVASELSDIQNIISMNGTYHAYFSDQYHYDIDIGNNTYRPSIEANEEKHKLSFLFHPADKAIYYQNSTGMNFTDLKLTVQYLKLTDSWRTV